MILRGAEPIGHDESSREIVVSRSTISRVGPVSGARRDDGPLLVFHDAIVFPGLVNSHDHLQFNVYPQLGHKRYVDYAEWAEDIHRRDADRIASFERVSLADRFRWGSLKNVLCGVTTVAHHGSASDELRTLSIGTVRGTSIHSVGLAPRWRLQLNRPIARPPYIFHVGEGTSPQAGQEIDELIRWNLFRRRLIGVHAVAMRPDQAARFQAVVWCPISNEFLYGTTADIASLKGRTTILFGTDSTLTSDWNLWTHLRRARALGALGDRELFACLTRAAARTWGLSTVGRIEVGCIADVVVARKKEADPWDAFFALNPEDILLVLKGGTVVVCDPSLDATLFPEKFSVVQIGATQKLVAEDVPGLLTRIRKCGLEPSVPIVAAAPWRQKNE